MTSSQSFKIYEILHRHFNNAEDAKTVVTEIETAMQDTVDSKKDVFLTKDDKVDIVAQIKDAKIATIIWVVSLFVVQEATLITLFLNLKK